LSGSLQPIDIIRSFEQEEHMDPRPYADQQPKRNSEDHQQTKGTMRAHPEEHQADAHARAEQASRSVMHPESYDPEWRYYHGAWGG
jgi:hypothetical protein